MKANSIIFFSKFVLIILNFSCSKNYMPFESPSRKEANVTRYVYGHTHNTNVPKKVGFLWAWNHMIPNKKWKSLTINNSPDGELFQLKMLKDFREFCANSDQRLSKFYQHCQDLKFKYSKNEAMMQNGAALYRNNQILNNHQQQLEQQTQAAQQQQPFLNNDNEQLSIAQLVLNYATVNHNTNINNNNNNINNGLYNFTNFNGQPQQQQQQQHLSSNNNN